ncbi:MAG: hypothetical protein HQK51_02890 [Oligoflexia bacterium]|nr:hypothetical protein [Oligoflexia bacterium]
MEKNIIKLITVFIFLLISVSIALSQTHDEEDLNMRRCLLLPIWDKVGGVQAFKVYERLEAYLNESYWCDYKTNSEILNILKSYERNLRQHLENPQILKTIAQKVGVGSLIGIELDTRTDLRGVDVSIVIHGSNGKDIYFKEQIRVERDDLDLISQQIINQLEEYAKIIPYDGKIIGILGSQMTIDTGKINSIKIGDKFKVKRLLRKKEHPLLKKIIDWETDDIALGDIYNITDKQSLGSLREFSKQNIPKIKKGDWIKIEKDDGSDKYADRGLFFGDGKFPDIKGNQFGKLGYVGLSVVLSESEASSYKGGVDRKTEGSFIGLYGNVDIWGTRNFWGSLEVERTMGKYKAKSGPIRNETNSATMSMFEARAGYKYLPMKMFYGPQVDGYLGYASYTYDMEIDAASGFGKFTFHGILFGLKAELPIYKDIRVFFRTDFFLKPGYSEDIVIYGEADKATGYKFQVGGSYDINVSMKAEGAIEMINNEAEFASQNIRFKDTRIRSGMNIIF